jgi:hypothetical protein
MFRRFAFVVVAGLIPVTVSAQAPAVPAQNAGLRFKWQANQTLTYKVLQQTTVRETSLDDKGKPVTTETGTNLALVKKWLVKEVDAGGVATLQMSITEVKNKMRQPDGTDIVVDSTNPEDAKRMAEFLNVPVVTVRVDAAGRIVEVKESKAGSTNRLNAELPFRMILPGTVPVVGDSWDRTFTVKVDPPEGTGESYEFGQKYTCVVVKDGLTVSRVETTLKAPPKTLSERVPLVPMLWTGEVYFNNEAGRFHAARLKVKAELPEYQGQGTRFEYESSYAEDAVQEK